MSIEAMKQALEALESWHKGFPENMNDLDDQAITSLRQAIEQAENIKQECVACEGSPQGDNNPCVVCGLAQPEQKPVAWRIDFDNGDSEILLKPLTGFRKSMWESSGKRFTAKPLYTSPPQHKPLTEKRIEELYSFWVVDCQDIVGFARAVERTVKGEV